MPLNLPLCLLAGLFALACWLDDDIEPSVVAKMKKAEKSKKSKTEGGDDE